MSRVFWIHCHVSDEEECTGGGRGGCADLLTERALTLTQIPYGLKASLITVRVPDLTHKVCFHYNIQGKVKGKAQLSVREARC